MKYGLIFIFVAGVLSNQSLFAQTSKPAQEKMWKSFDAGLEQAKATHKKILVDVYTDWCKWCTKMDKEVYTDPKVREYLSNNFVIVKMNAEGNETVHFKGEAFSPPQLAAAFGVTGYPATLFLKDDSDPITLLPGYMEAPMFLHVLSFIAENHYEKKQFNEYLKEKGVKQ